MFKRSLVWMLVGTLLITRAALAAPVPPSDLPDIVEKILPSVVNISSTTVVHQDPVWAHFWGMPPEQKSTSLGSGFLLDSDGFLFTNWHVINGAAEILITLHDKREYSARVVGRDSKLDLALLQIVEPSTRRPPPNLVPARIGNSDLVRIAEPVIAIGNPFGLQHTVTMGIISAKNRTIGGGPYDNFLQTDAAVNPGNSGGPLLNLRGEVIGINTKIFSRTGQSGGLNFAIPIQEALKIVSDLKRFGQVPRPWLGVLTQQVTPGLARYYQLPRTEGVLVYNLFRNSPASRVGLQIGDIVLEAGKEKTKQSVDLERAIAGLKPNDKLPLKVQRGRKILSLTVPLEQSPNPERLEQIAPGAL
jgi:serine protease Do